MATSYKGMDPAAALELWWKNHSSGERDASGAPVGDPDDIAFVKLAQENPAAWKLVRTGANERKEGGKKVRDIFNPNTGKWETQDVHGYWSHPESWMQLAFGGAMGGIGLLAATGAIGGGAAAGASAIPTTAGISSATALGLPVTAGLGTAGGATAAGAGAAAAGGALAGGGAPAAAVAPEVAATTGLSTGAGVGTTVAPEILATSGIPGAVTLPTVATTAGLPSGAGVGTTAALPTMADTSGLVAGDGINAGTGGGFNYKSLLGNNTTNAGISAFTQLYGTKMANDANKKAAELLAQQNKYSVDIQDAENKRAEMLLRQQNENQWKNAELTRLANYGQWAARERRIGNLGEALGMGKREIPDYMAGVDPNYLDPESLAILKGGGTGTGNPTSSGPTSTTQVEKDKQKMPGQPPPPTGDPIMDALNQNYAALGASATGPGSGPTDIAYFAKRIAETGGLTPDNTKYWFGPQGRIAQEMAQAKNGGAGTQNQQQVQPGYQQFQYSPMLTQPLTAPVGMGGGTLGSMAQMQR